MAHPIIDLRGRRFGRLVAPERARPSIRNHKACWPCVCDCGRRKRLRAAHLLAGSTVSCGCQRADLEVRKAAKRTQQRRRGQQRLAVLEAELERRSALRRLLGLPTPLSDSDGRHLCPGTINVGQLPQIHAKARLARRRAVDLTMIAGPDGVRGQRGEGRGTRS